MSKGSPILRASSFNTLPRKDVSPLRPPRLNGPFRQSSYRQASSFRQSSSFRHLNSSASMPEFSLTPHTPSPIPAAGQPRVKGILWKQGGGRSLFGQANWKKRYCVIIGDNLFYYANRQAYIKNQRHLKKPYRLQDCDVHFVRVSEEAETSHDIQKHKSKSRQPAFYFTIQPRNSEMRALHLRAATLAERDEWVRNIRDVEVSNMIDLLQVL